MKHARQNLTYQKNNTKKPRNFDLLNAVNNLRHLESSRVACGKLVL